MARRYGASDTELDAISRGEVDAFDPNDRVALVFAEKMTRDAHAVTQADVESVREHWADAGTVELAAVIGLFNYLNRFAEALDITPTKPGEGGPDAVDEAD